MDEQAKDEDKDGRVVISTIHKAKGLEWDAIFLTNCYEGSLPHMYSMGNETEIEEEMRLFYVALTRARNKVTICVPTFLLKKTSTGWTKTPVEPSRFLTMLGIS
jgi:DNA helicase-2/ATP-dependent DNA helicase PcrA